MWARPLITTEAATNITTIPIMMNRIVFFIVFASKLVRFHNIRKKIIQKLFFLFCVEYQGSGKFLIILAYTYLNSPVVIDFHIVDDLVCFLFLGEKPIDLPASKR